MQETKFLTVGQMKELEALTIKEHGIPAATLMENAGQAVSKHALESAREGDILVFAGYGNNGGDGLVAARYLKKNGHTLRIFLVGKPKPFSQETNANYEAVLKLNCKPQTISSAGDIESILDSLQKPGLIIDAIFGIGIRGRLDSFYIKLIEKINDIGSAIISVDVPSGLDADSGEPLGAAIKASQTVTFGFLKKGFQNPKAGSYLGKLLVEDIGFLNQKALG